MPIPANAPTEGVPNGPLVKWLRQRPLTPLTSVRIRYGSPQIFTFPAVSVLRHGAWKFLIWPWRMLCRFLSEVGKVLDKRLAIAYDIVCSRNAVSIVGAD